MHLRRTQMCLLAAAAACLLAGCPQPHEPVCHLPEHRLALEGGPGGTMKKPPAAMHSPRPGDPWAVSYPRPWRYIVIHHSATADGNAQEFDTMHRAKGWDELGYHFVIDNGRGGQDGVVQVGPRWTKQKWGAHTGGTADNEYNNYGIGVCLVGDFNTHMPTKAQMESLRRLVSYLASEYDVPPSNIIGHRDAPNASTQCPGTALWQYVHGPLQAMIAQDQHLARASRAH